MEERESLDTGWEVAGVPWGGLQALSWPLEASLEESSELLLL